MDYELFEFMEQVDQQHLQEQQEAIPGLLLEDDAQAVADWILTACFDDAVDRDFFRLVFFDAFVPSRGGPGKVFRTRRFEQTILYPREFRQRFRVPPCVVDHLEEKLSPTLTYPTLRNNPLSARQQILVFLTFVGTNSFYHVLRDCTGVTEGTICKTVHR